MSFSLFRLPWQRRKVATEPGHSVRSAVRAPQAKAMSPVHADSRSDGEGGDAAATQFMSSRAMVDILVDEILRGASIGPNERSTRLYSLAAVGEDTHAGDAERFILLVKFRTAKAGLWDHLPALGAHMIKEIRTRLGVNVGQVYWSLSSSAAPAMKLPAEWLAKMGPRRRAPGR